MRGRVSSPDVLFYSVSVETLIPPDHPLRSIKRRVDEELDRLRGAINAAYSAMGAPSIPPEWLIKATLIQALFSIRSERMLCERIAYDLLFRWFLDMTLDDPVWDHSTFSKNRTRFAEHGLMRRFFDGTVAQAIAEEAAGSEHFSVDGTLIQAWGSMKSFRPKDEEPAKDNNGWSDFEGQKRSNATHASTTDPEARLARKSAGQGAMLAHSMHVLMDNRHGMMLDVGVAEANGTAEREMAETMVKRVKKRHGLKPKTLGADKGFDDGAFLHRVEHDLKIKPHVAIREGEIKDQGIAGEARRRARKRAQTKGYQISMVVRRKIEPVIGWMKRVAGLLKTRFARREKTQLYAYAAGAAYNLMRSARLEIAKQVPQEA
jgi:transposase